MAVFSKANAERDTAIMLGDPRKALYSTVVPFLISLIIGQINMLADLAWCSGLGADPVSAIQAVNPLYWVIFDVGLGVGLGCNIIISRRIGAGDREGAKRIIPQGIVLSIVTAALLAPVLYFTIEPMMVWMGAGELSAMGVSYLTPIIVCNIFQVMSPTLSGFLRGEGAARRSNYAMIVGTLVNIIFDPILIYVLDMGVTGAGIATAMSCVVSSSVMLYFYLSKTTTVPLSFKGYRFCVGDFKEIMYLGLPKMSEMFLMDALDAINRVFLIQCAGVDAMVLFSVPFRILMFAAMIPNAFGLALTPVASANIGARKPENSIYAFRLCMRNNLLISVVLIIIYLLFASYLIIPFSASDTIIHMRPELDDILRVDAFMIPGMATCFICNAMLQSMRKPMLALLITMLRTGLTTMMFAILADTTIEIMCLSMVSMTAMVAVFAYYVTGLKMKELRRVSETPAI